jgi:hypothetical protein
MLKKYTGFLEYYSEQGVGPFPCFCDEKIPFDFSAMLFFDKKCLHESITIYNPNNEIVYHGKWTFSREKTSKNNYFPTPEEIDANDWVLYCMKHYKAEIITIDRMKKDKCYLNLDSSYYDCFLVDKNDKTFIFNGRIRDFVSNEPLFLFHNGSDHRELNLGKIDSFNYHVESKKIIVFINNLKYLLVPSVYKK